MSAFGHYVRILTDEEQAHLARMRERYGPRFYACGHGRKPNRCETPATHMTGYRYVTGRAGRVSSSEQSRCETHAAAFAAKHGVAMPDAPAPRPMRTGGDLVADALSSLGASGKEKR